MYFNLLLILSFVCTCNTFSNLSRLQTFTQNDLLHNLPTVAINLNDYNVRKNSHNSWKVFLGVARPDDIDRDDDKENPAKLNIHVTATYPLFVFYNLNDETEGQQFSNSRDAQDIYDKSTFKFRITVHILINQYLKSRNHSYEFRSIDKPFFGVSVSLYYSPVENSFTLISSPDISPHAYEYFSWRASEQSNICNGNFFIDQVINTESYISQRGFGCTFLDGKPCWKWCGNNSDCNPTTLRTVRKSSEWSTQLAQCDAIIGDVNTEHESFYSTPIILGLPQGETQTPDIYFNYYDVKPEMMVKMDPFSKYQELNSIIRITCTFSDYYASPYFKFAFKHKNKNDVGDLEFFEVLTLSDFSVSKTVYSKSMTINLQLRSTSWERVFCFAPVLGSYDWINASQPIQVFNLSNPTFLGDTKTVYSAIGGSDKNFIVQVQFGVGSKRRSIVCNATGYPIPTLTWTGNNNSHNLQESDGEVQPYKFAWSELILPEINELTQTSFICTAGNSQGVSTALFNVVVGEDIKTGTTSIISIVTPITVIGLCILLGILLVLIRRKYNKNKESEPFLTDQEYNDFMNGSSNPDNSSEPHCLNFRERLVTLSKPFDSKFIVPRSSITFDVNNVLGSGQYGLVLKGWLCRDKNGAQVAVAIKTMQRDGNRQELILHFKALLSELKINAYLESHPNIVGFFGACTENIKNGEVFIAMEICNNGDLLGYLRNTWALSQPSILFKNQRERVSIAESKMHHPSVITLVEWTRDIANGMSFLKVNNVIHGDLAARNVLLGNDNVAKIGDFGLSRQLLNDYSIYVKKSNVPLPWRWMALESLTESKFSVESDIWAFGVTMWEIFSLGIAPYSGFIYNAHFIQEMSAGYRLPQPELANNDIYELMKTCWDKDPLCRPTILSALTQIQNVIQNIQVVQETSSEEPHELEYSLVTA